METIEIVYIHKAENANNADISDNTDNNFTFTSYLSFKKAFLYPVSQLLQYFMIIYGGSLWILVAFLLLRR